MIILNKFGLKEMFDFEDDKGQLLLVRGLLPALQIMRKRGPAFAKALPNLSTFLTKYGEAKKNNGLIPQNIIDSLPTEDFDPTKVQGFGQLMTWFYKQDISWYQRLRKECEAFANTFKEDYPQPLIPVFYEFFNRSAEVLNPEGKYAQNLKAGVSKLPQEHGSLLKELFDGAEMAADVFS